jgi:hypothetical protein
MAGPAPKTEKWTARENLHDYKNKPDVLYLLVGGTVEVSDADEIPVLKLASGGRPKTLTLDLSIQPCSDPAIDTAVWKAANFSTAVEADQYNSVDVRWDGKVIASTPVINDLEHSKLLDKQAKVQNTVVKVKSQSPAKKAKKAVARVVKAVEDFAEGAKETLKTALKKVTPKKTVKAVTKKATKKAAKKTAKSAKKTAKSAGRPAKKAAKPAKKTAKKAVKKTTRKPMPKKKAKRR